MKKLLLIAVLALVSCSATHGIIRDPDSGALTGWYSDGHRSDAVEQWKEAELVPYTKCDLVTDTTRCGLGPYFTAGQAMDSLRNEASGFAGIVKTLADNGSKCEENLKVAEIKNASCGGELKGGHAERIYTDSRKGHEVFLGIR